jgi:error-prone DNA polymerase
MTSSEKQSFSANRAAEPQDSERCTCSESDSGRVPYNSIDDLIKRVPEINKREIRALSIAGALNFDNTVHRRHALWQSELAIRPAGDLFSESPAESSEVPFIKRMEGLELVEADLKKTRISIGKHPMAFIRGELNKKGVLTASQTKLLRGREMVAVAGAAVIRQRPMTAKNVVFITLEDETGHSNFVVMPDVFERFRAVINQNDFLLIKGIAEDRGLIKGLYFEAITGQFTAAVDTHNFR